jgi:hypothetical protein
MHAAVFYTKPPACTIANKKNNPCFNGKLQGGKEIHAGRKAPALVK